MCHNKNELRSAIANYRRLQAQKAEVEKELESAKAEIFEYLDYHEIAPKEKVTGQNFVISFSTIARYDFDKKLLAEALGDDLRPYQIEKEYRRLYVK